MASGEEIVKYVTQKVVEYIDTPSEERKQQRMERRSFREPWHVRWFGMLPMALSMAFDAVRRTIRSKKAPPADSKPTSSRDKDI